MPYCIAVWKASFGILGLLSVGIDHTKEVVSNVAIWLVAGCVVELNTPPYIQILLSSKK